MKSHKDIAKERIKQARQSGKSEIAKNLCEYYYWTTTLEYYKQQEKRDLDSRK